MSHDDQPASFATTRWSIVVAAGQTASPHSREALEQLCRTYWYPLYAFVRRKGYQPAEAQDLTQAFFTELLEKGRLQRANRELGRFRSFLLAAVTHFISNQWRQRQAIKRGGQVRHVSWDVHDGEARYAREPADELTPERIFEQKWAMAVLDAAVAGVQREYAATGKSELFEALKPHLTSDPERLAYGLIAQQLQMTEGAVKVAAHRLRARCREWLRAEIAATVSDSAGVDEELAYLFSIV